MTKVYEAWLDDADCLHTKVLDANGITLRTIPANACGMSVDGAYVAIRSGDGYCAVWCATRKNGSAERMSHCDIGTPVFATVDELLAYVDAKIAMLRAAR